ncbi:hypothetical protein OG618_37465 (plasmid) [Kitasatospora sp. NBC_01246]|uniref:hypothetical protein n=1 Tax=Kitasatospora sp. NBC_01246 TaxID=2903570 RepID=UPI002E351138|nr:hypothetical protein [Kitasatospora sp. NBC_01246]
MTKKNQSAAARRARAAQQAGSPTPYTALLRATPPSGAAAWSLRTLFVQLAVTAPGDTAEQRRECAQLVADAWATLTGLAGDEYPAAATVMPLHSETADEPGFVQVVATVQALRDWTSKFALADTADDLRRTALHAVAERWPKLGEYASALEELDAAELGRRVVVLAEAGVRTRGIDPRLAALLPPPERTGRRNVSMVPVVAGGEGKTIAVSELDVDAAGRGRRPAAVDLDPQPNLTAWSDVQEELAGGWPYRLVDARWQGWLTAGNGLYKASYGFKREGLEEPWPYARIVAERGPVRPVNHEIEGDDSAERLAALWQQAGRKAVASTLVALYLAEQRLPRLVFGGPHPLTSGREGSWESERLLSLAWGIGEELSEKPKRYDEAAAEGIADILEGWVRHPESYTEVAETLSALFGRHADRAGGWKAVADQWFQPGARAGHDLIFGVATWLMKSSAGFDPDLYR